MEARGAEGGPAEIRPALSLLTGEGIIPYPW